MDKIIVQFVGIDLTEQYCGVGESMQLDYETGSYGYIIGNDEYLLNNPLQHEVPIVRVHSLSSGQSFSWMVEDLEVVNISLEEACKRQARIKELAPKQIEFNVLNPTNFDEIDFFAPFKESKAFKCNITTGVIVEDKFIKEGSFYTEEVCNIFNSAKHSVDCEIEIPLKHVNFLGYSEDFIKKWIELIQNLNIVDIKYLSKITRVGKNAPLTSRVSLTEPEEVYKIRISSNECIIHNYFAFMLLRYLFNARYNNIPGLCVQIMKQANLSFFQSLLICHTYREYSNLFGLFHGEKLKGSVVIPDFEMSESEYFTSILETESVSNSIKRLIISDSHHTKLVNIIKNKEFLQIPDWISKVKDNIVSKDKLNIDDTLGLYFSYQPFTPKEGRRGGLRIIGDGEFLTP